MSAWAHTSSSSAECHLPQTFRGGPNAAVARLAPHGHGHGHGRRRRRLLCRCCPVRCRCLFVPVFHRVPRVSARARPARSRGGRRGARATQRAGAQASPTHPRRGGGGACDLLGGGFTHHRTRSPVVVASVVAAPPSPNHEPTQRRAGPNGGIGRGAGGGGSGAVLRTVIRRGDVLERPRIHSTDVEGTSPPAAEQAAGRAHWWARIGRATERKAEEGGHRGRGAYLPSEEESAPP